MTRLSNWNCFFRVPVVGRVRRQRPDGATACACTNQVLLNNSNVRVPVGASVRDSKPKYARTANLNVRIAHDRAQQTFGRKECAQLSLQTANEFQPNKFVSGVDSAVITYAGK